MTSGITGSTTSCAGSVNKKMRDMINLNFNRDIAKNADFANWMRQAQKKEWEAIPEAERPTWEQFKRGLKKKKK